jgi:DNA-binding Xre family transcriptional regulator
MVKWKLDYLIGRVPGGVSLRELSAETGLALSTLWLIKQGKPTRVELSTINALLCHLSVRLERTLATQDLLEFTLEETEAAGGFAGHP